MSAAPHSASFARRALAATAASALGTTLLLTLPAQAATEPGYVSQAQSAAALPPVAVDAFGRTTTGGWGSATTGGAWTTSGGTATDFSVAGGVAAMKVRGAGWHLGAQLAGASTSEAEVQAQVGLDKLPSAGSVDLDLTGRAVDASKGYKLRTKVMADGSVRLSLVAAGATTTTIASQTTTGLRLAAGGQLEVRLQVTGTNPTALQAKAWPVGTTEPAAWNLAVSDSTAGLQVPGGLGLSTYTSGSATNVPITARFSDVWVGTAPAEAVAPGVMASTAEASGPTELTTGTPVGTRLTVHQGNLTLSTPGQVVSGLDVRGFVRVTAPNVTIKNSIIRGAATSTQTALITNTTVGASVKVVDTELYNSAPGPWVDGLRGSNFTLTRVNVHDVIDMAHVYGDNVVIEDSYLHDNLHYEVDPAQNNTPSHDDSIQIQKGTNIKITGNRIEGAFNTGIQFTQDQGIVSNVTVDQNYLDGGGCTINLAEKGKGPFQGITITNNTFGRDTKHYNCAIISPTTTKPVTANNYFVDGVVATVRKG